MEETIFSSFASVCSFSLHWSCCTCMDPCTHGNSLHDNAVVSRTGTVPWLTQVLCGTERRWWAPWPYLASLLSCLLLPWSLSGGCFSAAIIQSWFKRGCGKTTGASPTHSLLTQVALLTFGELIHFTLSPWLGQNHACLRRSRNAGLMPGSFRCLGTKQGLALLNTVLPAGRTVWLLHLFLCQGRLVSDSLLPSPFCCLGWKSLWNGALSILQEMVPWGTRWLSAPWQS